MANSGTNNTTTTTIWPSFFFNSCVSTTTVVPTTSTTTAPPICFSIQTQTGVIYQEYPAFGNTVFINGKPSYILSGSNGQVVWYGTKWLYLSPSTGLPVQVLTNSGPYPISGGSNQWTPNCGGQLIPSICTSVVGPCPTFSCNLTDLMG